VRIARVREFLVKEVATTRFTLEEVREYLGVLAARRGLPSAYGFSTRRTTYGRLPCDS
jgi:hypothetical protein